MKIYIVTIETCYSADDAYGSRRWSKQNHYFLNKSTAEDFKSKHKNSFPYIREADVNED